MPDAPRWFERLRQRGHPGEESARLASAAREHACASPSARPPKTTPLLAALETITIGSLDAEIPHRAKVERKTKETQDRRRGEPRRRGPRRARDRRAVPRPHAGPGGAARDARPRRARRRATSTSTRTTRWRTSASRWARRWRRRSATRRGSSRYGHAYVPLDEALSRVVIDLSGRPGPRVPRAVRPRDDRRLRRRPRARVLPGLRQSRARHAARRQPARAERAPPGRDRVQGVRPRAADGRRPRSARGGHDAIDQGHACRSHGAAAVSESRERRR